MAEYWVGKKVLVTGASGFVGQHLVNALVADWADVAGTKLDEEFPFLPYTYNCNLINYSDVNRVISRFQPEVVFHLAAQPIVDTAFNAPFDTFETNVRGTYNLFDVCSRIGCVKSFVHFSTDKVYGETDSNTVGSTEQSPLNGTAHPYNASKLCGDIIAQSYAQFGNFPVSIIRSGNIYGEGDTHWDRLIPYVCKMLATEQTIELRSDGFLYRDYIYISDVIDALLLVGQQKRGAIYNLGSDQSYPVKDIVQKLREISGVSDKSIPIYKAKTKFELRYQHMDYSKINKTLGWSPKVGIDEGLKKTYAWYEEQYGSN